MERVWTNIDSLQKDVGLIGKVGNGVQKKRNQCHNVPCRKVILEHIYARLQGHTDPCKGMGEEESESESNSLM